MSSGEALITSVEPVEEKLDAETTALIGDFVLSIMRADHVFAPLSAELPFESGKGTAGPRLYAALLVAICSNEARGKPIGMKEAAAETGVDFATTMPKYVKLATDAGHIIRYDHPTDKRRVMLRPSKRVMHMFEQQMPAIARIASKIKDMKAEDVAKIRDMLKAE